METLQTQSRTRKLAGKALLIFLALMAVLTLASRALNELAVAQVSQTMPQRGALERRIEGTGQLKAAQSLPVFPGVDARVAQVHVKAGADVKAGDPLLTFDLDALSEKLTKAQTDHLELEKNRIAKAGSLTGPVDDSALVEAQRKLARAQEDLTAGEVTQQRLVDQAQTALDWAKADQSRTAPERYAKAQAEVDKAQAALDKAQEALAGKTGTALEKAQRTVTSREEDLAEAIRTRDRLSGVREVHNKQQALDDALLKQADALKAAQQAIEDAQLTLEAKQRDLATAQVELALLDNQLTTKQAEMDKLQRLITAGGALYAPIDGRVAELKAQAGAATATDTAALTLAPLDAGLELLVTVTSDQAGDMAVGEMADVTLGTKVHKSAVQGIAPSAEEAGKYQVSFFFPSDAGHAGMNATMVFKKRTQNYDCVIPLSALHKDNSTYFVYTIGQREGALGVQTTVTRQDVVLLEKDSKRAAVQGGINMGDRIVSRTDREIADGDRVRLEGDAT